MERLNFDHMGERGPTDVLSFPLHEWSLNGRQSYLTDDDGVSPPGPLLLGDVVIDLDQALRQAADGDWGVLEELVLLAIHGTLHLLGHDHAEIDEEERMRGLEHEVLGVLHRRHREIAWQPGSLFDRSGHAVTTGELTRASSAPARWLGGDRESLSLSFGLGRNAGCSTVRSEDPGNEQDREADECGDDHRAFSLIGLG